MSGETLLNIFILCLTMLDLFPTLNYPNAYYQLLQSFIELFVSIVNLGKSCVHCSQQHLSAEGMNIIAEKENFLNSVFPSVSAIVTKVTKFTLNGKILQLSNSLHSFFFEFGNLIFIWQVLISLFYCSKM